MKAVVGETYGSPDVLRVEELLTAKTIRPVISERYTLEEVPKAFRKMESEHTQGKLVILP